MPRLSGGFGRQLNLRLSQIKREGSVMLNNLHILIAAFLVVTSTQALSKPPEGNPPPIEVDAFVTNDDSNPVPVKVQDVGVIPFQIIAQNGDSNLQGLSVEIFVVPAGKRLIIEYVGWQATVDPGEVANARISTRVGGNFTNHRLGTLAVGNPGVNGGVIMEDGKLVKLFADPETTVNGVVFTGPNGTVENVIFSISGSLVDVD